MKLSLIGFLIIMSAQLSFAQNSKTEQEIIQLSKDKWQWMADKNADKLEPLFHNESKFVHMSGTWKKDEELEIIKSGSIWYKKATVHDTAIEIFGKTAIVWNRITLEAVVRGVVTGKGVNRKARLEPDYAGGGSSGKCGYDGVYRYRSLSEKRQKLEIIGLDFQQCAGHTCH